MKYNLDEQLSKLSLKQIKNMIQSRMVKETELSRLINKYDDYPYTEIAKYQRQVKSADRERVCLWEWFSAAFAILSPKVWDQIVGEELTLTDGSKVQLIDIYHSNEMNDLCVRHIRM